MVNAQKPSIGTAAGAKSDRLPGTIRVDQAKHRIERRRRVKDAGRVDRKDAATECRGGKKIEIPAEVVVRRKIPRLGLAAGRSEERRGGKEGRLGGASVS